jgi:hypothetical protein
LSSVRRMKPSNQRLIVIGGRRVARINGNELGVVVEMVRRVVKVKWDRGKTSYYRPDMPANVKLAESAAKME